MPVSKSPRKKTPAKTPKPAHPRGSREAVRLITFAKNSLYAGSRAEMLFWERETLDLAMHLIDAGNDSAIEGAMAMTVSEPPEIYDVLAPLCETATESATVVAGGQTFDTLLLAVPLVVWSRYAIPAGNLATQRETLESIMVQLRAHVLASNVRASMVPVLHSLDQMPLYFAELRKAGITLSKAAIVHDGKLTTLGKIAEPVDLLADSRFLLVGIAVPTGAPFFKWQEHSNGADSDFISRDSCAVVWETQSRPLFAKLLPACEFECLLPDAFFAASREADRRVRPNAIRAGVAFISDSLKVAPGAIRAVIAGIGDPELIEYRVSFIPRDQHNVVHGAVWPAYMPDDNDADIERVLRECQITDIIKHESLYEPEHCDDCGAPLFANVDGEMVHPEWPGDTEQVKAHYH